MTKQLDQKSKNVDEKPNSPKDVENNSPSKIKLGELEVEKIEDEYILTREQEENFKFVNKNLYQTISQGRL